MSMKMKTRGWIVALLWLISTVIVETRAWGNETCAIRLPGYQCVVVAFANPLCADAGMVCRFGCMHPDDISPTYCPIPWDDDIGLNMNPHGRYHPRDDMLLPPLDFVSPAYINLPDDMDPKTRRCLDVLNRRTFAEGFDRGVHAIIASIFCPGPWCLWRAVISPFSTIVTTVVTVPLSALLQFLWDMGMIIRFCM